MKMERKSIQLSIARDSLRTITTFDIIRSRNWNGYYYYIYFIKYFGSVFIVSWNFKKKLLSLEYICKCIFSPLYYETVIFTHKNTTAPTAKFESTCLQFVWLILPIFFIHFFFDFVYSLFSLSLLCLNFLWNIGEKWRH